MVARWTPVAGLWNTDDALDNKYADTGRYLIVFSMKPSVLAFSTSVRTFA